MKQALQIAGALVAAFGIFFFLQGASIVRWPASSFMVDTRSWMLWGGLIAAGGLALIWLGRRR